MQEADWVVGELLKKLDDLGIADNTIVVFSSDNGAEKFTWPDGGSNPFHGEKGETWEGGFRVPAVVRWPGVVEPGSISNEIFSHEDWLPTLLAAAGDPDIVEKLKKGHQANGKSFKVHIDGYNQMDLLAGKGEGKRQEVFYFDDRGSMNAVRIKDWKVHFAIGDPYRASYPHPATGNEFFEIQSRARALDNNFYVVAPNMGTYYLFPEDDTPIDTFGGRSFIIDHRGQIVGRQDYGAGSTYVGGIIDIEALRHHRASAQWDNWLKDIRTELYQLLYEKPIYPKNLYLKHKPMKHAQYKKRVTDKQIALMHKRGYGRSRRGEWGGSRCNAFAAKFPWFEWLRNIQE